jgi:4-hydroxy-tetrahydrodipicolinate synthase
MNLLPDGAWAVMLTPFHEDSSIDWRTLDAYTDWLIEHGSAGLFPVALSGEMYDLTEDERLAIAVRVVARAAGRVPVLASVVERGSGELNAAASARLAATGVDAVVLIASMLLDEGEDETGLVGKLQVILDANPGIAFGIYECPLPYHRILSTAAVEWMATSGRFVFFKETSHEVALMAERVRVAAGTPMKVFNAGIETLVDSLAVGVSGLSGWVVNVYPEHVAWLCAESRNVGHDVAHRAQDVLDQVERSMGPSYPNSAKLLVAARTGLDFLPVSRWNHVLADPALVGEIARTFDSAGLPALSRR